MGCLNNSRKKSKFPATTSSNCLKLNIGKCLRARKSGNAHHHHPDGSFSYCKPPVSRRTLEHLHQTLSQPTSDKQQEIINSKFRLSVFIFFLRCDRCCRNKFATTLMHLGKQKRVLFPSPFLNLKPNLRNAFRTAPNELTLDHDFAARHHPLVDVVRDARVDSGVDFERLIQQHHVTSFF